MTRPVSVACLAFAAGFLARSELARRRSRTLPNSWLRAALGAACGLMLGETPVSLTITAADRDGAVTAVTAVRGHRPVRVLLADRTDGLNWWQEPVPVRLPDDAKGITG